MQNATTLALSLATAIALFWALPNNGYAYTANKVVFEFLSNGKYRVIISYTVPELKEFRESYVDFSNKKEAERFCFNLLRGADFFPSDPKNLRYIQPPSVPEPW